MHLVLIVTVLLSRQGLQSARDLPPRCDLSVTTGEQNLTPVAISIDREVPFVDPDCDFGRRAKHVYTTCREASKKHQESVAALRP